MKKLFLFKEWLNKSPEALFGFSPTTIYAKKNFYDEEPMERLNSDEVLKELVRKGKINQRIPARTWENIVEYGDEPGGLHVSVSPLGSYKIIIRKYGTDIKGNVVPICKNVIPLLNDFNHKGNNDPSEDILADDIYEKLIKIDSKPLDTPSSKYEKLENLIMDLAKRVRMEHPPVMNFGGVAKIAENCYIIYLTYKGYGNGVPNSQKAEEFIIYTQYKPEKGLIHSWGCEINSPVKQRSFMSTPSEWDELFAPSQTHEEIIDCIMKILSTY